MLPNSLMIKFLFHPLLSREKKNHLNQNKSESINNRTD